MYLFLLFVIYLSFVGLGLPESLLGSLWPIMRTEFSAPLDFAGVISLIFTVSKTLSGLVTDRIDRKLGHGKTSLLSMAVMSASLFGCALSHSQYQICFFVLPLGLASGIIDTAINDYVARNYSSKNMSWLHCSWGIGSMLSPFAIGFILSHGGSWRGGYTFVACIQAVITVLLLLSLPRWKKTSGTGSNNSESEQIRVLPLREVFRLPGIFPMLIAMFSYCAAEVTASLWASSFLIEVRGFDAETAATCTSAVFIGITLGRFLCSFAADQLGDSRMALTGGAVAFSGAVILTLSTGSFFSLAGLFIIGFGCGPVVPSLLHISPSLYGRENSSTVVGIEMASAHLGSCVMPPLFGLIAEHISIRLFPFYVAVFILLMLITIIISARQHKNS